MVFIINNTSQENSTLFVSYFVLKQKESQLHTNISLPFETFFFLLIPLHLVSYEHTLSIIMLITLQASDWPRQGECEAKGSPLN